MDVIKKLKMSKLQDMMASVTTDLMGAKFRTKLELERFIRRDLNLYMCAARYINIFFYKEILNG
jgi:hypothetical protein